MGKYNARMVKWIGIIIIAGVLIYFMTKLDTHIGEDYVKDNNEKKDNTYYLIEGDSPEKVDLKYAGKIGNSNYNSFTSNCEEKGSEVYRYNDSFIVVFGKKGSTLYESTKEGFVTRPVAYVHGKIYGRTDQKSVDHESGNLIGKIEKAYGTIGIGICKHDPDFTSNCEKKGAKVYEISEDKLLVEHEYKYIYYELLGE